MDSDFRKLNTAQHAKLDAIAKADPAAVVFGWETVGPLIERSDGRVQLCRPEGRLTSRPRRPERVVYVPVKREGWTK